MRAVALKTVDVSKRAGWVWTNWIPEKSPTTLYGDGGKGKSLCILSVMRSVVTGDPLPDGSLPGVTGNCLIVSGEDSKEEIQSRLLALGGSEGKYGSIYVVADEDLEDFTVPKKWKELGSLISKQRIVLWAIDPILNFTESKVRTINDSSVREHIFRPMQQIMNDTDSTGLILTHMNKDSKGQLVSRASGSGAFVNAVRSSIAVMDNPSGSGYILGVPKTNRAATPNPLNYHLYTNDAHKVVTIDFDGEVPDLMPVFSPGTRENNTQLGRAAKLMRELLAGGPVHSKLVRERIEAMSSIDTFNKAKKLIGAESRKVGSQWMTYIPGTEGDSEHEEASVRTSGGERSDPGPDTDRDRNRSTSEGRYDRGRSGRGNTGADRGSAPKRFRRRPTVVTPEEPAEKPVKRVKRPRPRKGLPKAPMKSLRGSEADENGAPDFRAKLRDAGLLSDRKIAKPKKRKFVK